MIALFIFLLGLAMSAVYSLAAGWALMLAVGVIHHEWIPACPTIGYWWAVLLTMLVRAALHPVTADSGSSS